MVYAKTVTADEWRQITGNSIRYKKWKKKLESLANIWEIQTCHQCNGEYLSHYRHAYFRKYCSPKCRIDAANEVRRKINQAARVKICLHCGIKFQAKRVDTKFCTGRCRVAYHRQMKRINPKGNLPPPKTRYIEEIQGVELP